MKSTENKKVGENLNILAKASFFVFLSLVLSKVLAYFYRIIIARAYGVEIYGLFSLAVIILGWFIAFASLGLYEGLVRYIAIYLAKKQENKVKTVIQVGLKSIVLSGLIMGVLLFLLAETISIRLFNEPGLIIFLKSFSILVPVMVLSYHYLGILRGHEKIKEYSLSYNVIQNLGKVTFIIILGFIGLQTKAIILAHIIGTFCMLFVAYFFSRKVLEKISKIKPLNGEDRKALRKELFSYSLPLIFFLIIYNIFYWVDSVFIGYFKTSIEVGFYNSAVPIAALLTLAPEVFIQMLFPMISKEYSKNDIHQVKEITKQTTKWIFLFNLPIFLSMAIFPSFFISILFGQEYLIASSSLRILALGNLIFSTLGVSQQILSTKGKSRLIFRNSALALLLNLVLNLLLIPRSEILSIDNSSGMIGASIATAISLVFFGILLTYYSHKELNIIPFRRKMLPVLLSGLASAGLVNLIFRIIDKSLISQGILIFFFFLIYFLILILTKSLDRNDLQIIKNIKEKFLR